MDPSKIPPELLFLNEPGVSHTRHAELEKKLDGDSWQEIAPKFIRELKKTNASIRAADKILKTTARSDVRPF